MTIVELLKMVLIFGALISLECLQKSNSTTLSLPRFQNSSTTSRTSKHRRRVLVTGSERCGRFEASRGVLQLAGLRSFTKKKK